MAFLYPWFSAASAVSVIGGGSGRPLFFPRGTFEQGQYLAAIVDPMMIFKKLFRLLLTILSVNE
jgi:hypothetical protein